MSDQPKYSLKAMILAEEEIQGKEDLETHLHKPNRIGASNVGGCVWLRAWKEARLPTPEITGLKADKSVFPLGHLIHGYVADKSKKYGQKNHLFVEDEVIVETKLTNQTIVESPIDIAISQHPIFVTEMHEFKNKPIEMHKCVDPSKLEMIFDTKSCGEYEYWHVLQKGPSFKWKAQMHIYMKATNLMEITILMYYKPKGWMSEIVIKWDDEIWNKINTLQTRVEELTLLFQSGLASVNDLLKATDLEYFGYEDDPDFKPICWYSCPFSVTKEDVDDKGKPSLVLEKPCPFACHYLQEKAMAKFKVGQMWKRGLSHITIDQIMNETIFTHNKGGKKYEDSIYLALNTFEPL